MEGKRPNPYFYLGVGKTGERNLMEACIEGSWNQKYGGSLSAETWHTIPAPHKKSPFGESPDIAKCSRQGFRGWLVPETTR